jgi:uncharacterized damage-inducible protein DinB
LKRYFEQMAAYNRWANARLHAAALGIPEEAYRRDVGAFFGSLSGTLNHLLVADRMWMRRFTGEGTHPDRLDAIIHDNRKELVAARADEDDRIVAYVGSLDAEALEATLSYRTSKGVAHEQPLKDPLVHFFNHQTHHRGQAHTILSIVTGAEPPPLDLLVMQRGAAAPDLRALVRALPN